MSLIRDPVRFPFPAHPGGLSPESERSIPLQNGIASVASQPKFAEQVFLQRIYQLLAQRSRVGSGSFPRGLMEPGYSPEEMARRELFEETGLSVERIQEIGTVFSNTGLLSGAVKVFVADVKEAAGTAAPEDGEVAIGEIDFRATGKTVGDGSGRRDSGRIHSVRHEPGAREAVASAGLGHFHTGVQVSVNEIEACGKLPRVD